MFGENGLAGVCKAVFSKQAAPKSLAFLFCHEPLPPGSREESPPWSSP